MTVLNEYLLQGSPNCKTKGDAIICILSIPSSSSQVPVDKKHTIVFRHELVINLLLTSRNLV